MPLGITFKVRELERLVIKLIQNAREASYGLVLTPSVVNPINVKLNTESKRSQGPVRWRAITRTTHKKDAMPNKKSVDGEEDDPTTRVPL